MNPREAKSVFRYFDLADSFVQIQVSNADALRLASRPTMNRASYRRMVIDACMPEFRGHVERSLELLFPEDPLMVEDLLYQLCVEVNPSLDIHEVRLLVDPDGAPASEPALEGSGGHTRERLLARLRRRARGLKRRLDREVIGQGDATAALERAVTRAAVGLAAPDRPLASFLFTGRTGTGKTELARRLADELFDGDRRRLVRVDCGEFALGHEHSKLIGAPPGYVGHEHGGQLTEALGERPECVVLFDEVEKAHPRLHALLLSVLEEGELTDGKGNRVRFDRSIVVLTSNAGASEMTSASNALGFERPTALGRTTLRAITEEALAHRFSPEFLGRIDETIVFDELGPEHADRIAQRKLFDLARRARERGLRVAFTPAVAKWVARRGFSTEYGARDLLRVVRRDVEPRLSTLLLEDGVGADQIVRACIRRGELHLSVED